MNMDVSTTGSSFPQPDFEAIGRHRNVVAQCADAQGAGSLRDQLLTVLERVYVVDVELITMLDGVCGSLRGIDMEPYRAAMHELEREGRTQQESLALLAYQEQAVNELLGAVHNAQANVDTLKQHLVSVETAVISDTRELARHAQLLLQGVSALSNESHRRTLAFLVEDMNGPLRVDAARRGYVEEITKLLSPVEFFCHSASGPGLTGIQRVDDFQHHAAGLTSYLQTLRRNWRS